MIITLSIKRFVRLAIVLFLISSTLLPARAAFAAGIVVNSAGDNGPGDCTSTCTLRDAIASAQSGDEITFSLPNPATITLAQGEIVIDKDLTLTGPSLIQLAIDAHQASRIFTIRSGSVNLSGMTLKNGKVTGDDGHLVDPGMVNGAGGAIYIAPGAAIQLQNVTLDGNTAIGGKGGDAGYDAVREAYVAGGGGGAGGSGAYQNDPGAAGQFGGGGGGGSLTLHDVGGTGGFGGGGGGGGKDFIPSYWELGGTGGTGGGVGGGNGPIEGYGGGGGGAGMGGAIFVDGIDNRLGRLTVGSGVTLKNNTARGGAGGSGYLGGGGGGGGAGAGSAIFNRGLLNLDSPLLLNNQTEGGEGGPRTTNGAGEMLSMGGLAGSGLADTQPGIYDYTQVKSGLATDFLRELGPYAVGYSAMEQPVNMGVDVSYQGQPVVGGEVIYTIFDHLGGNLGTPMRSPVSYGQSGIRYRLPGGVLPGTYAGQIMYSGTDVYLPYSATISLIVEPMYPVITLSVQPTELHYSIEEQVVSVAASIVTHDYVANTDVPIPDGSLFFTLVNPKGEVVGTAQEAGITNGNANVSLTLAPSTPVGSYTVRAYYPGTSLFHFTNGYKGLSIKPPCDNQNSPVMCPTMTTLTISQSQPRPNQPFTLNAQVTSTGGKPDGEVVFKDGDVTLGSAPLGTDGSANLTLTLPSGRHSITAEYSGQEYFSASPSPSLTVNVSYLSFIPQVQNAKP